MCFYGQPSQETEFFLHGYTMDICSDSFSLPIYQNTSDHGSIRPCFQKKKI